jgi:hypothetical protein
MPPHPPTAKTLAAVGLLATVTVSTAILGGWAANHHPLRTEPIAAHTSPEPIAVVAAPTQPGVDYTDPATVCVRFADAVYRHDTRTDTDAQAAYRRAAAYVTAELATVIAAQPPGRDPQWAHWSAHRAATAPTVIATTPTGDTQPTDTPTQTYRSAEVTVTPVGVDGWHGTPQTHLVFCTLRREPDGWRIEQYSLTDLPGPS